MKKAVVIGPIGVASLWCGAHYLGIVNPVLLPSPVAVFNALLRGSAQGHLLYDVAQTFTRFAVAFVCAAFLGIVVGLLLGYFKRLYESVEIVVDFLRSVPAPALFPLFMLFFGVGDTAKVAVGIFACSFIVIINTAYGVKNASRHRIMLARSLHAKEAMMLSKIILPDALPHICSGLRVGISFALVVVIVTEMFLGTQFGLGHRIIENQLIYEIPEMYACILLAGTIGYIMNKGFLLIETRVVHWAGK